VGVLVAIAEGRTSCEAEMVLQTLKGERLTVLFTMTLPPPPAPFDNVLVTLMDITERKRAEYLTAQVFESSPDRVAIVGRDYKYQRVNPVFERKALDRCFRGEDVSSAGWFSGPLGRRYLARSYSPLRPDSDRVDAALVIVRDLTRCSRRKRCNRPTRISRTSAA
jgi:hypothetical protein